MASATEVQGAEPLLQSVTSAVACKSDEAELRRHHSVTMSELDSNTGPVKVALLMIVLYFAGGVLYYTQLAEPRKYHLVDAVYFCVVTITTVGYGDINSNYDDTSSNAQMLFTSFFVFFGVGIVGAALGIVMGFLLDREDELAAALEASEDEEEEEKVHCNLTETQAKLAVSMCCILVLLAIGTLAYAELEGKTFVQAFYWSCVTVTTVGYGDIAPTTAKGKWFSCVYLLIGTVLMAKALSDIAGLPLEIRRKRLEAKVLAQYGGDLDPEELVEIAEDPALPSLGLMRDKEGQCTRPN